MKPKFVGRLNFAPQDPAEPKVWQLEEPFGLLYLQYFLIVLPWHKTDGASIPFFLRWILGTPFGKKNRFWAIFHDGGYGKYCRVIDLSLTTLSPEKLLECYGLLEKGHFVNPKLLGQDWWDKMCRDGSMVAAGCWKWKRNVVYSGLRRFGWLSWNRHRK